MALQRETPQTSFATRPSSRLIGGRDRLRRSVARGRPLLLARPVLAPLADERPDGLRSIPARHRASHVRAPALARRIVAGLATILAVCGAASLAGATTSARSATPVVPANTSGAPWLGPWAFAFGDTNSVREARSEHVLLASESHVDPVPLLLLAEDALTSTREWLGLPPATPVDVLQIRLVNDVESLFDLEARHGLPSSREYFRTHEFRGRCYAAAGLIVLPASADVGVRWQLVHEVTHAVNAARTGACPSVLDEGLAELVPYWILGSISTTPETLDSEYDLYDRRLAQATLARELPTLDRLLTVDDATFHDPAARWLWYALSWKLVKVMVESDEPLAHGRFAAMLDAVASGHDLRSAIRDNYDFAALENAWRRAIATAAPWRPMFGDWSVAGDALTGRAATGTSSSATLARRLFAGESFELSFTLAVPPQPGTGFGFVFDAVDASNFVYVEFRPDADSVVIAEREAGRWTHTTEYAQAQPWPEEGLTWSSKRRFALSTDAHGGLAVFVDGRLVARHELGRILNGGALGVMLESYEPASGTTTGSAARDVTFGDVVRKR